MFKKKNKNRILVILGVLSAIILLSFQNCGDVHLLAPTMTVQSSEITTTSSSSTTIPTTSTSTTTPAVTTTTLPGDPIITTILPGAPAPQWPGLQLCQETIDVGAGIHAGLYFYNLSQKPATCPNSYKVIQGWRDTSNTDPNDPNRCTASFYDLANPSLRNIPIDQLSPTKPRLILQHDIRFLRPQAPTAYAFRIRTPDVRSSLSVLFAAQYEGRLTYTILGCDVMNNTCGALENYISVSRNPCEAPVACKIDSFGANFQVKPAPVNESACELQTDSIYYININYPGSVIDPNIISGSNYRTELKIIGTEL